jgi:hypothetical protein
MKFAFCIMMVILFHTIGMVSFDKITAVSASITNYNNPPTGSKMIIKIGNQKFSATLIDNATANAFKSRLPITVDMIELNGNEKFADLAFNLPTKSSNPGTIQSGDLMMYGSNTLVLFYKTFSTSYSYTKLGKIDDVKGLEAALGKGNVTLSFVLE